MELLSSNYFEFQAFAILLSICLFIFLIYKNVSTYRRMAKLLNEFPGPRTIPIFGNALSFTINHRGFLPMVSTWLRQYGGEIRVWLAHKPVLICASSHSVQKVLTSASSTVKGEESCILASWLGDGLFIAKRHKWAMLRKLLTPAFHFKALENFVNVFSQQSTVLVEILENESSKEETIDVFQFVGRATLDMICENAMGIQLWAQTNGFSNYSNAIKEYCELVLDRILLPWLRIGFIWNLTDKGRREKMLLKTLHSFTEDIVRKRMAERKGGQGHDANNFLDLLLDIAGESGSAVMTDLDIREQTDTFTFGGFATTALSISTTLFFLAQDPDVQEKVFQEVQRVIGINRSNETTLAQLSEMKYLECCIKESLRIFPPVPLISRNIEENIEMGDGRIIPRGTTAVISPYFLHRDESVFPDPEKFDPERFSLKNITNRHPYAYIPFAAGPRNCIGQKYATTALKTVISKIVLNFELGGCEKMQAIEMVPEITLRPINGVRIKMKKRIQGMKTT